MHGDTDSSAAHARVDLDRMYGLTEVARRGVSWLMRECQDGPVWVVRNSKVIAVVSAINGSDGAE